MEIVDDTVGDFRTGGSVLLVLVEGTDLIVVVVAIVVDVVIGIASKPPELISGLSSRQERTNLSK